MGLKDLLLNKGWAGKTISRPETVDRLNPLIRKHYELLHAYAYAADQVDGEQAAQLQGFLRTIRTDIGKLSETVLSSGGVSYNGVDMEPGTLTLSNPVLADLRDREADFEQALVAEQKENHHIRTRGVLSALHGNSKDRLSWLRGAAKSR